MCMFMIHEMWRTGTDGMGGISVTRPGIARVIQIRSVLGLIYMATLLRSFVGDTSGMGANLLSGFVISLFVILMVATIKEIIQ